MTFAVKKGVTLPAPDKARVGVKRKYPFDSIAVGELFFVPEATTEKLSTYASLQGRKLKRRFRTQTATMRQDLQTDEWEPCKPGAPGAKKGVAICRIA